MITSKTLLNALVALLLAGSVTCRDALSNPSAFAPPVKAMVKTKPAPKFLKPRAPLSAGHFSIAYTGLTVAGGAAKACFSLSSTAECDPAKSACCAAGSPTPNAARIMELQLKLDAAAVTQCLSSLDDLNAFKQIVWTVGGGRVTPRYVKASEVLSVKRKWMGTTTLCVEIPDGNAKCASGLDELCGAGGCQITAVTTRFDQAGDASKLKKSCKLTATVPLTEESTPAPTVPAVPNPCDASPCGANSICTSTPAGAFTCACALTGYASATNDGRNCFDVNECAAATNPCGTNSTCTNTDGAFLCTCDNGYASPTGNGRGCQDINECTTAANDCGANSVCTNTDGGFTCACSTGFTSFAGDGRGCYVDACAANGSPCLQASNTTCRVNGASSACGCVSGYQSATGVDGVNCLDIDECAANPCGGNSTCTNTLGGYICTCNTGYGSPTRDGKNCGSCTRTYALGQTEPGSQCASTGGNICNAPNFALYNTNSYQYRDTRPPGSRVTTLTIELDGRLCPWYGQSIQFYLNGFPLGAAMNAACDCADCTTKTWTITDPDTLKARYNSGGYNTLHWSGYVLAANLRITVTGPDSACEDCQGVRGAPLSCGAGGVCSGAINGCTCSWGWLSANSGTTCVDIDECATGAVTCSSGYTCFNMPGGARCACGEGLVQHPNTGTCTADRVRLGLSGDENDYYMPVSGANFTLFGKAFTNMWISTNGWLFFDWGWTQTRWSNPSLPSAESAFMAAIFPFFDDLYLDGDARLYMAPRTWSSAGATVIEWYNAYIYNEGTRVTFQAWLFYDGRIGFRYLAASAPTYYATGGSATIGMQLAAPHSTPTKYIQLSYNTTGAVAYGNDPLAARLFVPTADNAAPYYTHGSWADAPWQPLGP